MAGTPGGIRIHGKAFIPRSLAPAQVILIVSARLQGSNPFEAFRIANMAQAISKKPAAVVIRRAQPCTGGAHGLNGCLPTACEQHLCLTGRLMEADYFVNGVSAAGPRGVTGGCVGTSKDSSPSSTPIHWRS
jgi:hypothetical protein